MARTKNIAKLKIRVLARAQDPGLPSIINVSLIPQLTEKHKKKESTELHELNFKNLFAFVVIIVSYFCLQRHFGQVLIGI